MKRAFALVLIMLAMLWPAMFPSPPNNPSAACAEAQLRYESEPTRDALQNVLRSCD
jgi:hypothetical protein